MTEKLPVSFKDVEKAASSISAFLKPTQLTLSVALSEKYGRNIYCKWDNKLRTGSFKERGVCAFLSGLSKSDRKKGVCAASAGNHALALSYHSSTADVPCTIFMPEHSPVIKVENTERMGARVIESGETFDEAYTSAKEYAEAEGLTFVPPFDDKRIIAGQGTAGIEILEQCPEMDALVVPVGGGGLVSGLALAVKEKKPDVHILGVQSSWAAGYQTARPVEKKSFFLRKSIADGIAVKSIGNLTGRIIDALVDECVKVSEDAIATAIIGMLKHEKAVIEGAAAAGLAALSEGLLKGGYKNVVLMISGSNIDMNVLSRLIDREQYRKGRISKICLSVPDRPGSLSRISMLLAEAGANILKVNHDRSFATRPGNVELTLLIEVRGEQHFKETVSSLERLGVEIVS